ncbi:MAG: SusC/RagA family TonB-linked outer membrane protein [Candidatus Symbiothrix sp.]|jgi:TonB-linked SusC/RagA family outer membrane protein|nr:SusC/RagA family TonB-linked outer membrane protein [Candidatus Symbiothrix sp.]
MQNTGVFAQENAKSKNALKDTIAGIVSADGFPLPGATVKNMTTGLVAITDNDGRYQIGITDPKNILQFSFLGFKRIDRVAGVSKTIDIILEDESTGLEEVVVVGYGVTKKRDITGSIVSVNKEDIEKKMPSNIYEALQGGAAGVQISSGSGQPGEGASVVIRGLSTMNDAGVGPLWVVDGVPTTDIGSINPYDIETMEVLKDAASAAIYGSRSANGVIIVTTKKGSEKAPVVEVRYQHSLNQLTHKLPQMNAQQYRGLQKQLLEYTQGEGAGIVSSVVGNVLASQMADSLNYLLNADNDYQDLAFRTARKDQLDLSFGGGNEQLKYMLLTGFLNEQGIIHNTSLRRLSARINTDYKATSKLTLGTRANFSFAKKSGIDENGYLNSVLSRKPNLSLYYPDETLIGMLWGMNPLAAGLQTNFTDIIRASFSQFIEYMFTKDLKFTTSFNANFSLHRYNYMRPTLLSNEYLENFGSHNSALNYDWMNENYFNYTKTIRRNHNLTAMLGFSLQSWKTETDYYSGKNSATDAVYTQNAFAAHFDLTKTGTTENAHNMASLFGRFTYNYKFRYLFTANVRADGSSRFAKNKKIGYFPSLSAAWRFSDEPFMWWGEKVKLNDAKLRIGYGITGNESIGDYESMLTYSTSGIYDGLAGVTASRIAVNDLGWEQTAQKSIGIDLMFMNSRFQFTADLYDKTTENLLANYEIPKEWGFNTVRKNIGSIANRGLELSFAGDVVKTKDLTLNLSANISFNRNKVLELAQGTSYIYNDKWWISEDRPLGDFYGYTYINVFPYDQSNAFNAAWEQLTPVFENGIFQNKYLLNGQEYTGAVQQKKLPDGTPFRGGDINWQETEIDGVIDDKDRSVIGNAQADYTGGLSFNLRYKNWTLYLSAYYSIGGKIYNQAKYWQDMVSMESFATVPSFGWMNDFWVKQGDEVTHPRPYADRFQNNRAINSIYIEDASYIKIRNTRLSYRFNTKTITKIGLKGLSAYIYVNNPLTFTAYSGYDPEFSSYSALALGEDTNRFPRKSEFGMGINVNF